MYKGENFSREIIDTLCDDYKDDEQLVMDMLRYLYYTSTDDKMKEQIVMIFNDFNYCLECGSKMQLYEYDEIHDELTYNNVEHIKYYECPICDK